MKLLKKTLLIGFLFSFFLSGCTPGSSEDAFCEDLVTQVSGQLNKANHCQTDDDCVVLGANPSWRCYTLGNKNADLSSVLKLLQEFRARESCAIYIPNLDCPVTPNDEQIVCRQNRCVEG